MDTIFVVVGIGLSLLLFIIGLMQLGRARKATAKLQEEQQVINERFVSEHIKNDEPKVISIRQMLIDKKINEQTTPINQHNDAEPKVIHIKPYIVEDKQKLSFAKKNKVFSTKKLKRVDQRGRDPCEM
ncbi:MAG: hypothetical protein ATN35_04380 [Epulopiscium sp. Nele67-Bin004]|nr:MAG: hypothetical protein ATN35_04380 [Epulopiscium sp. Nele67-Bin004]